MVDPSGSGSLSDQADDSPRRYSGSSPSRAWVINGRRRKVNSCSGDHSGANVACERGPIQLQEWCDREILGEGRNCLVILPPG